MNCKVNGVFKNIRYRLLTIDDQTYILDLTSSFWRMLFPFFIWMFPNTVYKVDDDKTVEKLRSPEVQQTNTGGVTLIGGGLAVIIANLLRSLTDYFNFESSTFVNSIIVVITITLLLSLFVYINKLCKKNLYKVVKLEELASARLWIKPKPVKHFFFILASYLAFLAFTVLGFWLFIEFPNVLALLFTMMFFFLLLFVGSIAVAVGHTVVKFISGK